MSKKELHQLLDQLPESELHTAQRFLEFLKNQTGDPFLKALQDAPEDDEPETPQEAATVQEAWGECLSGDARPWEEVRKELADE